MSLTNITLNIQSLNNNLTILLNGFEITNFNNINMYNITF